MPLCVICGKPLVCADAEHVSSDSVVHSCPLKKGAIWVHVMDDLGGAVKDVEVSVDGAKKPTEANGFAHFDPLDEGLRTAALEPLSVPQAKAYDPPGSTTEDVSLSQGEICYLAFTLTRKAKLKVNVVKQGEHGTHFDGATVTVTGNGDPGDKQTVDGIADYGELSAGPYSIKAALKAEDAKNFYPPDAPVDVTLVPGDDRTVDYEVSPLARPQVKVVWDKGAKTAEDVGVKLKKGGESDLGKTANVTGLAAFPVDAVGLRGGEHEVLLAFDDKVYMPSWSTPTLTWTIAEGSTETKTVTLIKLARPKIEVVCGTDKVEDVGVKLKKDPVEHDLGKSAKTTGLTELTGGTKGVEPDAEHEVLLDFDKAVYVADTGTAKLTFAEGSTDTHTVKLIKLARPKVKVVDKTSGMELEGIGVKLTATDSTEHNLDKTGKSGFTEIASGKPGLPPDKYTIAVSGANFAAVLDSPADVTFAEGSTETVIVKVTAPKGVLRVKIDRYDGVALPERVSVTVAKASAPTTILHTVTTAEREVEVDSVDGKGKRKVRDDWKEVEALDPDTYVVKIPNLKAGVLDKQGSAGWTIGPSNDADVKVAVKAGKTAEVEFTLTKYKKVQFIGFNVKPGYKDGYRCPTCFKQYDAPGTCTVGSCASAALKSMRCDQCGAMYPAGTTNCTACHSKLASWCTACAKLSSVTCGSGILKYHCWVCNADFGVGGNCPTGCMVKLRAERIYLGLADNHADLLARCLAMKSAITTAYAEEKDKNPEVLKVFMGPEFYFRGLDGAYPLADLSLILEQMRKETQKTDYKDWLFVFGTAIGYLAQGSTSGVEYKLKVVAGVAGATKIKLTHKDSRVDVLDKIPKENETLTAGQWKVHVGGPVVVRAVTRNSADEYEVELVSAVTVAKDAECRVLEPVASEIFNVALFQKGGPGEGVAGLREGLVYKESISSIDYLRNAGLSFGRPNERMIYLHDQQNLALPTEGAGGPLARRKNIVSGEATKTGLGGGSVFTIDGITFGVEVCLDHLEKKLYTYSAALPTGAAKVQVHLIPSWGMSIKPDSLAGKVGTQIFNVDGPDGSDAATVTKLSPSGTWTRLATPTSHAVADGAKEDVKYMRIDPLHPENPAQETEIKDLEPKFAFLVVKHDHKVNGSVSGKGNDYAWVDLYAAADIPPAETV